MANCLPTSGETLRLIPFPLDRGRVRVGVTHRPRSLRAAAATAWQ